MCYSFNLRLILPPLKLTLLPISFYPQLYRSPPIRFDLRGRSREPRIAERPKNGAQSAVGTVCYSTSNSFPLGKDLLGPSCRVLENQHAFLPSARVIVLYLDPLMSPHPAPNAETGLPNSSPVCLPGPLYSPATDHTVTPRDEKHVPGFSLSS